LYRVAFVETVLTLWCHLIIIIKYTKITNIAPQIPLCWLMAMLSFARSFESKAAKKIQRLRTIGTSKLKYKSGRKAPPSPSQVTISSKITNLCTKHKLYPIFENSLIKTSIQLIIQRHTSPKQPGGDLSSKRDVG
jgi:hypothetical protein